jgi:hypothetical protein
MSRLREEKNRDTTFRDGTFRDGQAIVHNFLLFMFNSCFDNCRHKLLQYYFVFGSAKKCHKRILGWKFKFNILYLPLYKAYVIESSETEFYIYGSLE